MFYKFELSLILHVILQIYFCTQYICLYLKDKYTYKQIKKIKIDVRSAL